MPKLSRAAVAEQLRLLRELADEIEENDVALRTSLAKTIRVIAMLLEDGL